MATKDIMNKRTRTGSLVIIGFALWGRGNHEHFLDRVHTVLLGNILNNPRMLQGLARRGGSKADARENVAPNDTNLASSQPVLRVLLENSGDEVLGILAHYMSHEEWWRLHQTNTYLINIIPFG